MWFIFKRLSLALGLLFLCSALLLISDWKGNKNSSANRILTEPKAALSKKWNISFVTYSTSALVEQAQLGTQKGFQEAGLVAGRDFESRVWNANGDMANLNNIVDAVINSHPDLVYTYTTPALQAISKRISTTPIIFTLAVDPLSWGLAKSHQNHPPNITGIYLDLPAEQMLKVVRECIPKVRKIGTVFTPTETNSTFVVEVLEKAATKNGIQLLREPASSSTEVPEATEALIQKGIDAICQIADNNTSAAFAGIAKMALKMKTPLFCFSTPLLKLGAAAAVSVDSFDAGREGALLAARVIRGEEAARIPMQAVRTNKLVVYPEAAKQLGLALPSSLISKADEIIQKDGTTRVQKAVLRSGLSKKWNIHRLNTLRY